MPIGLMCDNAHPPVSLLTSFSLYKNQRNDGNALSAMNFPTIYSILLPIVLLIRALHFGLGLDTDGVILMSFKFSITTDPFGVLQSWNYHDDNPCSWYGVTCAGPSSGKACFRVTRLELPNSGLSGSIPAILGMIQFLTVLNLSNNSINGSIPSSLFSACDLQILDLSNNLISGQVPELVGKLQNVQMINLSDNSLSGNLPVNLTVLPGLVGVYLRNNYFSGSIPGGFNYVRVLDLSSNLIDGSLPLDFGGRNLAYLNVSGNRLAGAIPSEFANGIPGTATIDLSYNNLTGQIPESDLFNKQSPDSFSGNPGLCGRPLTPCPIPSAIGAPPPDASSPGSPPAIAVIPTPPAGRKTHKLSTGAILGIVIGNVAGIAILVLILVCVCLLKRRNKKIKKEAEIGKEFDWAAPERSSEEEYNWLRTWTCLRKPCHVTGAEEDDFDGESTASESTNSDDGEAKTLRKGEGMHKSGALVTVGGERELELETLLRASAYIMGASGSSIMYKAVLEDGTVLAVRRIGENGVERFRDFQNQVRIIAKLVHPNLVRILGFFWGSDEKLIIYDFVPNGSLATARHRKLGATLSSHLPFEARLKIAKGVARGLAYVHEKKHVHGNLKPSNILLGHDMEPKIGDFGLDRLVAGDHSSKTVTGSSAWNFGSKRSNTSRDSNHDFINGPLPSPSPSEMGLLPYHAPESLRSLKPSPKWDVFSYGVVFLELLTGKVITSEEVGQSLPVGSSTCTDEEKGRILRMADVAIRGEMEGREEGLLGLMRLGFSCISPLPQKRPSMKEVLHALERFPSSSGSSYL